MPKRFFKRYMPHAASIRDNPRLKFFGTWLHDPRLWHLHRRPIAGGVAVGLFCAFIPVPMQMLFAAAVAIMLRVNLPLAVTLIWLTNPVTIPPLFYGIYAFGCMLLGQPQQSLDFEFSLNWLILVLDHVWLPILLGTLICASIAAFLGYWGITFLWRYQVMRTWRKRHQQRIKLPSASIKNKAVSLASQHLTASAKSLKSSIKSNKVK